MKALYDNLEKLNTSSLGEEQDSFVLHDISLKLYIASVSCNDMIIPIDKIHENLKLDMMNSIYGELPNLIHQLAMHAKATRESDVDKIDSLVESALNICKGN